MNELVREDQAGRQETVTYTYDDGGNLRTKSVHAYTLGEVGPAQKTVVYTYGNENWKDQLTA
ncbi:RHS repeat-associated core domain-containing protein, partial [Proteiniclasticum sp. BAD-10]|nr:RHS repeat-associated core domain-containing protein [Proteiniclasticum sediminis]